MSLSQTDLHFLKMAQLQTQAQAEAHKAMDPTKPHSVRSVKHRGAVIARGNEKLASGSSSHLGGDLHRPETEERYVATVQAEIVALGNLTSKGAPPLGSTTIYISDCPNWYTFKTLITLGFKRIVHYGPVLNERITHYAAELGIELISVG